MFEVEVHQLLRRWLREQTPENAWPHHLSVARLAARSLRLQQPTLLQLPASGGDRLYLRGLLLPLLLWQGPVVILADSLLGDRLLHRELPLLQHHFDLQKPLLTADQLPSQDFQGIWLTDVEHWQTVQTHYPHWPLAIVAAEDLEAQLINAASAVITPHDWNVLRCCYPAAQAQLQDWQARLTFQLFQRPVNPTQHYRLEAEDLLPLVTWLRSQTNLPIAWQRWLQVPTPAVEVAHLVRETGQFQLRRQPLAVAELAAPLWRDRPLLLAGEALDSNSAAPVWSNRLGLPTPTTAQFAGDRHAPGLRLFLPRQAVLPNTPHFQRALLHELRSLLLWLSNRSIVLIVDDQPLLQQVASALAAEWGSRVQVGASAQHPDNAIRLCSMATWLEQQPHHPTPAAIAIASLPFASAEQPLTAARIEFYQQQRWDWFRDFLLPDALARLQQAIAPLRKTGGLLAVYDGRLQRRSYGQAFLEAIAPSERLPQLSLEDPANAWAAQEESNN
ncbi:helicase C-terminal domain-containing protein [Synechococcus elongatus]|uniref:Helicase C-terminal domain-containing protein n=1 Tax=Synechococcus elongatus PCC 11801 TaxID=2219813 RepID=A0AAN1UVB4_SYNEL|nr:helicase C-terminal domain-containing protein [Synechococcus elongatus]AZB73507.1 helicase [Synechococcus elongatus PCC 11801]